MRIARLRTALWVCSIAMGWIVAASGCGSRQKVVRIAVALPLTGDLASEGQGLRRAVILAVEQANAQGRLPFRVQVAAFDDRADPVEAYNVAHLIVDDPRIVAVIGHYNSDCSARAAQVYAQTPLVMISPASTSTDLTRSQLLPGWRGARVIFRLVPTDDVQGAFAARFMRSRLGKRRMAVAHDGTLYGRGLADTFRKTFVSLGGKVVSEAIVPVGTRDPRAALKRLRAGRAEGLFFGGRYPEAGLILRAMRQDRYPAVFCSGDGARTPALFDVAGSAADGAYLSMGGLPVESFSASGPFLADYRARWTGKAEGVRPFDHLGYEAARIVIEALARVGPDRAGLVAAIQGSRHEGISGAIAFDEKGDIRDADAVMTRARAKDRTFPVVR